MIVIPAIDLMDGHVVRLKKGIMEDASVYERDPLETAKMFADIGARRIHIVDLNGARTGENGNYRIIEAIASKTDAEIEVGGGIRNMQRLHDFMEMGVSYAILGTVAVKNPDFTLEALNSFPNKIILGIDTVHGKAALEGWYEASNITTAQILEKYKEKSVESVIVTDIDKDGMLSGVNTAMIDETAKISPFPVIASGGVSAIKDITDLEKLNNPNIKGCIVGKAIYEGRINLKEVFSSR